MIENKLLLALSLTVATTLTGCGDGGGGDADQNVVRNLFAVGDIVEGLEDDEPIEGDVSLNDKGDGLTYALAAGSTAQNGELVFNADGTFIYTPNADFFGSDTVTYVATLTTTGETHSASLTLMIENDFESLGEYGWGLVWSDEFDGETLDTSTWTGINATVANGNLVITGEEAIDASVISANSLTAGRIEARIQAPAGSDVFSVFALVPLTDSYDGDNKLAMMEGNSDGIMAGAHYGLGNVSGVDFNSATVASASTEFHTYSIEWSTDEIRWYLDGVHVHTVDPLNTWAYNLAGEDVVVDNAGPFNQNMQIVLDIETNSGAEQTQMLVDYVKVWSCDPTIAADIDNCASYESRAISKLASDRIEKVEMVTTELFIDGNFDKETNDKISDLQPLVWHHTDEITELSISAFNDITIEMVNLEGEHALVIDVSHPEGDANIGIIAPSVEIIGKDAVLSFDMYIDSANTLTETLDIRMETGWPYMGIFTWNVAELTLDTWVTYSIPVSDFVNNPFIAPDWLNWIPGVVEGDSLPLDTSNVGPILVIESHGGVHYQLDNIQLTCLSNESCIQAPLVAQAEAKPDGPAPIRIEAEAWNAVSAGIQIEATADEDGVDNIGWTAAGEFLEYTINAPADGTYTMDYRLASQGGSDGLTLSIDGNVVDAQVVDDTGGWQEWATQSSGEFSLTAGEHLMRIDFIGGAININWFELFPPSFEIHLEAEAYDAVSAGIQIEATADEDGGDNIGWTAAGEFLEYTVNIPADGTYFIEYRLASQGGSDGIETSVGGAVVDTQAVADTGGWQEWNSQTASVDLVAGEQTLRIDFLGGAINLNWIKITN